MRQVTKEGRDRLRAVLEAGRWTPTKQGIAGIRDAVTRALGGKGLQPETLARIVQVLNLGADWSDCFTEPAVRARREPVKLQTLCERMQRKTIKAAIKRGIRLYGSVPALAKEIGINRSYLYAVAKEMGVEV